MQSESATILRYAHISCHVNKQGREKREREERESDAIISLCTFAFVPKLYPMLTYIVSRWDSTPS